MTPSTALCSYLSTSKCRPAPFFSMAYFYWYSIIFQKIARHSWSAPAHRFETFTYELILNKLDFIFMIILLLYVWFLKGLNIWNIVLRKTFASCKIQIFQQESEIAGFQRHQLQNPNKNIQNFKTLFWKQYPRMDLIHRTWNTVYWLITNWFQLVFIN